MCDGNDFNFIIIIDQYEEYQSIFFVNILIERKWVSIIVVEATTTDVASKLNGKSN